MATYDKIMHSGFPVTFAMVRMGWLGVGAERLNGEEVVNLAMEWLGDAAPDQFECCAELAYADPMDSWKIDRCLDELASVGAGSQVYASRFWRWLLLKQLIDNLETRRDYLTANAKRVEDYELYEYWYDIRYELSEFWRQIECPFSDVEDRFRVYGEGCVLSEHKEWLEAEETWLRAAA